MLPSATSGFYNLVTPEGKLFETFCDMDETIGGAWTGFDFTDGRIYLPDIAGDASIFIDCTEGLTQVNGEVECSGPRWQGELLASRASIVFN
jgi:hypothetical protein